MGKFDGILICSDIDGTFTCNEETVKVNKEAIKYFTHNGGKFTFVTGRTPGHLTETGFREFINAPAGLLNGSIVYDYDKKEIVSEKRLDYTLRDFLMYTEDCISNATGIEMYSDGESSNDLDPCNIPSYLLDIYPIKIHIRFDTRADADEFKLECKKKECFKSTCIAKSWNLGVELNNINGTKGNALCDIKSYLGNIHTTVGIGDYENDIELLSYADIKVATGNAIDELKKYADFTVKKCEEYAIKDLIEILDKKY